jgi:hypothetical protein
MEEHKIRYVLKRGPAPSMAVSLEQHSDPVWCAKIELGNMVYERSSGYSPASKLFYITSIVETHVGLSQVCPYSGEPLVVQINLQDLISLWATYKGEPPIKMSTYKGGPPIKMSTGQTLSKKIQLDTFKATLYNALPGWLSADGNNKACMEGLVFYRRPDEVRTTMKIGPGQLVFAPVAPLANFGIKMRRPHI